MKFSSPITASYRAFEERTLARYRLNVMRTVESKDVVIAAFPKSGNTWMQAIIAGLKYGVDASQAPDSLIQDLVPDLHQNRAARRYDEFVCFKSHHLPRKDFRRVIHLVRDGRDALVSYLHYRRALGFAGSIEELMKENNPIYGNWAIHLRAWGENPYNAEKLLIRYEDLLMDGIVQLQLIADFLNLTVDRERIEDVVRWTTASKLQERERRLGWDSPNWPQEVAFVRRAISGSYRDEMPQEAKMAFESKYGNELRGLGYCT